MTETKFRFFEFGEFRLDAHRRILQKNGEPVHLTPRIFDLLCVMVENAGRTLEHDELLEKVWEGAFVEQGNLKKTISALRQALGETPEASEFITTVPRKGYRFTATVRPLADASVLIRETQAEIIIEEEFDDEAPLVTVRQALPGEKKSFPARTLLFVGAIVLLSTVLFSVWYFSHRIRNNFSVEKARLTKVFSTNYSSIGVLSGNGNFFVYVVSESGKTGVRVRSTVTGSDVEIVPRMNASIWFPTFAPDGNYVYVYIANRDEPSKSGVYRVPTFGGALQLISEKNYNGIKVSPDGKRIVAFRTFSEDGQERQELVTFNPDGSDERQILVLPNYSLFRGLAWSPDGSSVTFGVKRQSPFEKAVSYVAEIPVAGGAGRVIMPDQQDILFWIEDWLPDKSSLVFRQREPNAEIYQIWQYFPATGEKHRVTKDDFHYLSVSVTADGKTLGAVRGYGLTSIWTADAGSYDFREIPTDGGNYYSLSATADNRLVFSTMENEKEFVGIMNFDGTSKRLLTEGSDGIRPFPEVSLDGKNIVFMSDRAGGRQVWSLDLEGRNLKKLTNTVGNGRAKMLSDGRTLFFTGYLKSGMWTLLKQTADGQIAEISNANAYEWDISPDEKYLAIYMLDEQTKKERIFVRDFVSGAVIKSFDEDSLASLRWTPDGQALSYIRTRNDAQEIVLQPLDDKPIRVLTSLRGEDIRNICWSRDGKRIFIVRSKLQNEAVLIQPETEK